MWIFSNGANIGASKIIGDAVSHEVKKRNAFQRHSTHPGFQSDTLGLSSKSPLQSSSVETPHLNFIGVLREDMIKYADQLGNDAKVCSLIPFFIEKQSGLSHLFPFRIKASRSI